MVAMPCGWSSSYPLPGWPLLRLPDILFLSVKRLDTPRCILPRVWVLTFSPGKICLMVSAGGFYYYFFTSWVASCSLAQVDQTLCTEVQINTPCAFYLQRAVTKAPHWRVRCCLPDRPLRPFTLGLIGEGQRPEQKRSGGWISASKTGSDTFCQSHQGNLEVAWYHRHLCKTVQRIWELGKLTIK